MAPKRIFTYALLAFALFSIVYVALEGVLSNPRPDAPQLQSTSSSAGSPEQNQASAGHKLIVYYFHGTVRCPSCYKIEAFADEAIHTNFKEQIDANRLEWRTVNVDEAGNQHFINDYKLYTKSVVVVDTLEGSQVRWKNLDRVWRLLDNKDNFIGYVREEVNAYLGGG